MLAETRTGFIEVPGGRVWYVVHEGGPGLPLLVLHGGPGLPHAYLEPLSLLSTDRPVVFFDQLGCGRSDRPDDTGLWTIDRFSEEVSAVRRALDLGRIHLLGHSWGSMLAAHHILANGSANVQSLTLASPVLSVPIHSDRIARLRTELPPDIQATLLKHEKAGSTQSVEYRLAVLEFRLRYFCRIDPWPDPLLRSFEGMAKPVYETMLGESVFTIEGNLKDFDVTARLTEFRMPTLLTCGRFDETHPDDISGFAAGMPASRLHVFEGSSHVPHIEEPDEYLRVLRSFLKSVDRIPD